MYKNYSSGKGDRKGIGNYSGGQFPTARRGILFVEQIARYSQQDFAVTGFCYILLLFRVLIGKHSTHKRSEV